jgi:hypothetical protein
MQGSLQSVRELPDGYALEFPPQPTLLMLLAEFIARERRCCPFFIFELRVEAEDGPFWLKMTGEEGIKPFLQAEMNLSTLLQAKRLPGAARMP